MLRRTKKSIILLISLLYVTHANLTMFGGDQPRQLKFYFSVRNEFIKIQMRSK